MAKASENVFPKVQFSEETAPATPSAGQAVVYVKTDGKLYLKDDAGTETDLTASGGITVGTDGTTKGDLLVFDGVDWERIGVGANDQVLTADSAQTLGVKWAAAGGGSGTVSPDWMAHLAAGDDSPAGEDNFDNATIGLTNIATTGTVAWTESRDLLSVKASGMTSNDLDMQVTALSGVASVPCTIEARGRLFTPSGSAGPRWFLGFTDGTTSAANIVGASAIGSQINKSAGTVTAVGGEVNLGSMADGGINNSWLYLRVVWISSNTFQVQWSPDGISWSDTGLSSFATTITPTHYGVGIANWASAEDTMASFEYLRVYDSDLSV